MKRYYTQTFPPLTGRLPERAFVFSLILMIVFLQNANSQDTSTLKELKGYSFSTLYSSGLEYKAKEMATKCDSAIRYMSKNVLGFRPTIKLFVLNPDDWKKYTSNHIYGMPHYKGEKLILAGEDNSFWKSFIPPMNSMSPEMVTTMKKLFAKPNGDLSFEKFFDLLALHELGHAFHTQDSVNFPRKWMNELFANLFLHTYIAEKESTLLPILEIAPKLVIETGPAGFEHTSLQDFESFYVQKMSPNNSGWYQARFHFAAKQLYDAGGAAVVKALWNTFLNNKKEYSDNELVELLKMKAPEVATFIAEW